MICALGLLTMLSLAQAGTIIDQIAAVVGKHAIKTSDLQRDLRVTQFLNAQTPDLSVAQQRASLQRLIDQELIRRDLAGSAAHLTADAKALMDQIRMERFQGSQALLDAELRRRGLDSAQLLAQLEWQLVVLRFIDERFRPGVTVTDDEVHSYYDQNTAALKQQYPTHNTFEELTPKIREVLEGEQINRNFEDWLQQARKNVRIDYKLEQLK
jgi:peptidyl-prolyl cis-trans isomerase SurA